MNTCKVHFLPDNKDVDVASGSTIMEAAEKAGVFINSLCGGNGVCGKCRVQVRGGKIQADTSAISFLSGEEVREGFVLACQAKVTGDMEIVIPPESRLESEQNLMDQSAIDYSDPEKIFVPMPNSVAISHFYRGIFYIT